METVIIPRRLILRGDGTVTRPNTGVVIVPPNENFVDGVATRDLVLDPQSSLSFRLFLPQFPLVEKLPVLLYFHGGAFCIGSAFWSVDHNYVKELAVKAKALCISVDYRLAPEHRLPAAYEDGYSVFQWIHTQAVLQQKMAGEEEADPWLQSYADFKRCFLVGESAGANIAHHVSLRVTAAGTAWSCVKLEGLILVHPFFGGEKRSKSERETSLEPFYGVDSKSDKPMSAVQAYDLLWAMALPSGADRDNPFCNPFSLDAPKIGESEVARTLVAVASQDPLKDRGVEYFEKLERGFLIVSENLGHGFHLLAPYSREALEFMKQLTDFINS